MSNETFKEVAYKVIHIDRDHTKTIFIFYGDKGSGRYSASNYEKMPTNQRKVFSEEEWSSIEREKPTLVFSSQRLYPDDSIAMVKIKVLNELLAHQKNLSISMEELYLFTQKKEKISSIAIYQALTQNKKISLTKLRLHQFLQNIQSIEHRTKLEVPEKDVYTYDDLFELGLDDAWYILNKPLGQKYYIVENEYPYICNPYDIQTKEYDRFLEQHSNRSLSTLNNHLLMNSGEIVNDTLFLCLATEVMDYASSIEFSVDYVVKIYYPFLYNKHIHSLEDLADQRKHLVQHNQKFNNEKTLKSFEAVDMLYDVYFSRTKELNYVSRGITFIKTVLKPEFDSKFPLEVVFKVVHATQVNPLIKFNPSSRQENVYRLYADKTATDGRKIPYLKKSVIFKLMKTIGKSKSVSIYVETEEVKMLNCEIDEYGYITIMAEFFNPKDVATVNSIFRELVNPVLQEIKSAMEQTGYKIQLFDHLENNNVEIKLITYETHLKIQKAFDLPKYSGCISSVFINETSNKTKTLLRLKRVANFSRFASQEAFILEKAQQGLRGSDIIQELIANYPEDITAEQAEEMVRKVANELEVERGARRSDIKIKDNPGFKTTITLDAETATLKFVTENINQLGYLTTLPIYIDTMVRLTQGKQLTNYPASKIDALCGRAEIVDVIFTDYTSSAESLGDVQVEGDESITYPDEQEEKGTSQKETPAPPKAKGAFDLFFDEDEDEDEEEDNTPSSYSRGGDPSDLEEEEDEVDEVKNIDHMKLNKPYYFQTQIEKRDPVLIVKRESKKFKSYARTCLSDKRRQPVVLTDDQLEKIKKEHPGFLREQDVIRYGSDEKHQHNYICPRYWCLKYNTIVKPEDLKLEIGPDGVKEYVHRPKTGPSCGKVLPKKEKEVKPGYYIYEFNNKAYPGLTRNKHPQGYCLPCCFKNYNTDGRIKAKEKCLKPPGQTSSSDDNDGDSDDEDEDEDEDAAPKAKSKTKAKAKAKTKATVAQESDAVQEPEVQEPEVQEPKVQEPEIQEPEIQEPKPKSVSVQERNDIFVPEPENETDDTYVLGPEKFPLEPGRWGYLPPEIQAMLREINANCQTSKTNTTLKKNHPCLLRHGVEVHPTQSFVACISDALFYAKSKILSIKDTKETILNAITIDDFIQYQNGNLVESFQEKEREGSLDVEKYETSHLYSKINLSNREELVYFSKVISAFENFQDYMRDPESVIDHTYLWDILSMPNKKLFPQGVNLVIFELPHDDITNNVHLICPTNHYSNQFFQSKKPTILLLKEDGYYEPIYSLEIKARFQKDVPLENIRLVSKNKEVKMRGIVEGSRVKTKGHPSQPGYSLPGKVMKINVQAKTADVLHDPYKESITKEFKETDPHLSKQMRAVFKELIKPFFELICKPLESMHNVYTAKRPLLLSELVEKLDKYEYSIRNYVMNFNNKIIGVIAEEPTTKKRTCFVPCYPSAYDDTLKKVDYIFMNNESIWKDYTNTVQFLNKLHSTSMKRKKTADIPCKPAFQIIEDEFVVGILTETNQFIQISDPLLPEKISRDLALPNIRESDYVIHKKPADVYITTETETDTEREDYIKRIKLESNFYNAFRNSIRILLNTYEHHAIREQLEGLIRNYFILYSEKLEQVKQLLRQLVGEKIQFSGDDQFYKLIQEVSTCIVQDTQTCKKSKNICVTKNNQCNMILPMNNLITGKKNEEMYYGKIADELVRYTRIQSFMFDPQMYLSFGNINYNLRENEVILLQSLLTQEYFDQLVPIAKNKYVKLNTYDDAQPILTQAYDNVVNPSMAQGLDSEQMVCTKTQATYIQSSYWKNAFPSNFMEVKYDKTVFCTYALIIDLIQQHTQQTYTMNEIKNQLHEEYKKYLLQHKNNLVEVLIVEGKKTLGDQVLSDSLSFSNMIYSDNYYLTTLDYWLLVTKYQIPTIFLSQKPLAIHKPLGNQRNDFVAFVQPESSDAFVFIMVPGLRPQTIPNFKILQTSSGENKIRLDQLKGKYFDQVSESIEKTLTIQDYLQKMTVPKKYVKKIKKLLIRDEEEDEDEDDGEAEEEEEEPEEVFKIKKSAAKTKRAVSTTTRQTRKKL